MFLRSGFIFPKSIWRCRVPVSECEHPPHARRRPADRPCSPLSARGVPPRASSRPAPGEASPPPSPRNAAITGVVEDEGADSHRPACSDVSAHFNYESVGVSFWNCSALFVQSSPGLWRPWRDYSLTVVIHWRNVPLLLLAVTLVSAQISRWRIHRTNVNWELQKSPE